ncbi:hypothetical protein Tco_0695460 [Tanacetum coccineum]
MVMASEDFPSQLQLHQLAFQERCCDWFTKKLKFDEIKEMSKTSVANDLSELRDKRGKEGEEVHSKVGNRKSVGPDPVVAGCLRVRWGGERGSALCRVVSYPNKQRRVRLL